MNDKKQVGRKIDSSSQVVGEVFRKPFFYKVPSYQRDFAWTSEHIEELWDDLTKALEEGRSEYFLGAIVISQTADEKWRDTVDGQQRLTALSMIYAAIAENWRSLGDDKRADGVVRDYIGTEDRRTGDVVPKLTLNEINDPVYQSLVVSGKQYSTNEKKVLPSSNRLLDDAFTLIKKKVSIWLKKYRDAEAALLDLEDFISDTVNLIVIEAGDESDAFIIFETLNDRGLDLAPPDLVKNYLFSLAGSHLDVFKRGWSDISALVGNENLTQFLRQFWLSEYAFVRERDLYRAIRSKIKSRTAARHLVDRLRTTAEYYSALINPEHSYWADFPQSVRVHLEALLLFNVTQFRVVAMAAMGKYKPSVIAQVLRQLMIISFRYTVVSSLGTGNLERTYVNAALDIHNGKIKNAQGLFQKIRSTAYVDDARFVNDFQQRRFTKANVARYILSEINDKLEADTERKVAERSGRITLEHILPKKLNKKWDKAIPEGKEAIEYTDLIGNLTLLEAGKNRGVANEGFSEKKESAYKQSELFLNRELLKSSVWTHKEIIDRSQKLALVAKDIWRLDY